MPLKIQIFGRSNGRLGTHAPCRSNFFSIICNFIQSSRGSRDFLMRGCQLPKWVYYAISLQFFCRKLHENERIWTRWGKHPWHPTPWIRQCSGGSRISPRRGRQLPVGCQHMILSKFSKNCMKLKEFGPGGASKILLCRSATAMQS